MNIRGLERCIKRLQEEFDVSGLSPIDDRFARISETDGVEMTNENFVGLIWSD